MASGCPVIAGDIPSLRERCEDAALYCDPYDAQDIVKKILSITNDQSHRSRLIHRGFIRNKNFTWSKCVENTCRLIVEMKSQKLF